MKGRTKVSTLDKFPIYFENMPSDELDKKIKGRFTSFKIKEIHRGWVAQVRPNVKGDRHEIAQIAPTKELAIERLDKQLETLGLYD